MTMCRTACILLCFLVNTAVFATLGHAQEANAHGADTHAAAAGQAHEGAVDTSAPPLKPEAPLFFFTLALFGGFLFVMKNTVWKPLIKGLDAREERIAKAENAARSARLEVEKLSAQAEKRMAEVQSHVSQILTQARAEAEAKKMEIVSRAEADAQRIKQEALQAIASAREAAVRELEQTVDRQVALATEHVAGRRM